MAVKLRIIKVEERKNENGSSVQSIHVGASTQHPVLGDVNIAAFYFGSPNKPDWTEKDISEQEWSALRKQIELRESQSNEGRKYRTFVGAE